MSLDIGGFLKSEIARKKNELGQERHQSPHELREEPGRESPEEQQDPQQRQSNRNTTKPDEPGKTKRNAKSETNRDLLQRLKTRPDRVKDVIQRDAEMDTVIDPAYIAEKGKTGLLSKQCNLYIHELLNEWSAQGYKSDLLPETKKSFFPLLVRLRKCTLPQDLLTSLATVLYHIQAKELHLATESYMKLSIGNVAWPIGVTSVGIHARSAQTRIQGDNGVANVMLDDSTRLWITSVKRLITFKEISEN